MPVDNHEELSRYLKDPIVEEEDCADVLIWWRVDTLFTLFDIISHVLSRIIVHDTLF